MWSIYERLEILKTAELNYVSFFFTILIVATEVIIISEPSALHIFISYGIIPMKV